MNCFENTSKLLFNRYLKYRSCDLIVVDKLLEGENSRIPTPHGVERIASKIASDGYTDVAKPIVVELRDRTQVQQYIKAIESHWSNSFFGTEVSKEDETLYQEFLDTITFYVIDGHHRLLALHFLRENPRFQRKRNEPDVEGNYLCRFCTTILFSG